MYPLLSIAYFPPLSYFLLLFKHKKAYLDSGELYQKQTYRNRCEILTANGKMALSIPVVRPRGHHSKIKDVRPDYKSNWHIKHIRAFEAAYSKSPFYEFYADEIFAPLHEKTPILWDLNLQLLHKILDVLEISVEINELEEAHLHKKSKDYRNIIQPKQDRGGFISSLSIYTQVFSNKFEFIPDLSILDLLFNKGPEAYCVLKNSAKRIFIE